MDKSNLTADELLRVYVVKRVVNALCLLCFLLYVSILFLIVREIEVNAALWAVAGNVSGGLLTLLVNSKLEKAKQDVQVMNQNPIPVREDGDIGIEEDDYVD